MSKFVKLEEFISPQPKSLISGPFGSNISSKFFVESGVPVIRGNNLTFSSKKFIDDGFVFVTESKADELKSDAIFGDIIFTAAGTIGQVGIIDDRNRFKRYVISNKQIRLRLNEVICNRNFIYFILNSAFVKKQIIDNDTGSTIPLINLAVIRNLQIPKFDLQNQNKIASVLSALDDKIELNNRINADLEAIAKLIYEYWFVQFDFPDINGKPYKSSGGKMVWNKELKREIPEGWEAENIMCIVDFYGGGTPKTTVPEFWNGKFFFYTPADYEESIFSISTKEKITQKGLESCSSKLFQKGTVFITARGSVGKINIASEKMAMNQSCYAFFGKRGLNYPFIYQHSLELVKYIKAKASGSIFSALVTNDFKFTKLPIPPDNLINLYNQKTLEIFEKILSNKIQNQELASLRDWLLPMLMNGQVTVTDAEEMVGEKLGMVAEERGRYGEK